MESSASSGNTGTTTGYWRVVMVPDDDNNSDILGLYTGIGSHAFDRLEPFVAIEGDKSVRAQVGKHQTAQDYQDIPLSVKVSDTALSFGIYFKFLKMTHHLWVDRCLEMLARYLCTWLDSKINYVNIL